MKTKNSAYLVLTIIFVILSAIGGYFLYQITNQSKTDSNIQPEITSIPTEVPVDLPIVTPDPIATDSSIASSSAKVSPTLTPTKKIASPTATLKPTSTPTTNPKDNETTVPTPSFLNFKSTEDNFLINYSSKRKLYQDIESSGRRYTFYLYNGNFAVHVGLDGQWAWITPDRNFSGGFLVSGQNTYRYDISTQTIVDIQYNNKNYTIQCVHNGNTTLKTECEEFISSFQFL